jgi:ribonucleotide reductase alpha subunit
MPNSISLRSMIWCGSRSACWMTAIDVSNFPLEQQLAEAKAKRRIGLGVTGLADALIMCNARYGSKAAVQLTGHG